MNCSRYVDIYLVRINQLPAMYKYRFRHGELSVTRSRRRFNQVDPYYDQVCHTGTHKEFVDIASIASIAALQILSLSFRCRTNITHKTMVSV